MNADPSGTLAGIWSVHDPAIPAILVPDDGLRITYGDLRERVDRLARRLARLGVGHGDRIGLVLPNGPEILELLLAAASMGVAAAPLNPAYTRDEFAFYLDDLAPQLVVVPEGGVPAARNAASATRVVDLRVDGHAVTLGGGTGGEDYRPGTAGDVALLLHTSGTTSRPKQVPLLQRNLAASARSMARHYHLTEEDVSGVVMPLFHVHGLVASGFASLTAGGQVLIPRRVAPGSFWRLLSEGRITWFSAGPTVHQMLLKGAGRTGGPPSRRLRFARSCSSPLSPELMAATEEVYRVPMVEAYGMTEASHEMTANPLPPGERRPGTVGIPTGCQIRIMDDRWNPLPAGTAGEVAVRGPGLTPGYLGNAEANRESFRDGWFRTGDKGVVEDGYLRLVGRIKELILRGGENISPGEVEEVLKQHAAVVDAAVFGIPDEKYGELVAAAVSLASDVDEQALITHCRSYLTAVKVPVRISVLDEIPRTPTGKLQRRRVAELVTLS